MILSGKLIKGPLVIKEAMVEKEDDCLSFTDLLEECLIALCRELDIQVPMWFKKNTEEFARYRRTSFDSEQFFEKVRFDRFDIRLG